jgi:hypothetical protein
VRLLTDLLGGFFRICYEVSVRIEGSWINEIQPSDKIPPSMRAHGKSPAFLQGRPGGRVRGVAAGRWYPAHLVTDSLELLDQEPAKSAPPVGLVYFHENIAERRIIMKGDSASRDDVAVVLDQPIAIGLELVLEDPFVVRLGDRAKDGALAREIRRQAVLEEAALPPTARELR